MTTTPRLFGALLVAGVALAPGCSPDSRDVPCRAIGTSRPAVPNPAFRGTVFTIVMENHSAEDILGPEGPPYLNALARQSAVAAGYYGVYVHPSEPNYLWMVAGENFGVGTDNDPDKEHVACTSHIADQIERAGLTWRSYQESMGAPCGLVSSYPYAAKHNPFVYFEDINGWDGSSLAGSARCRSHVVDYSELARDMQAGTVPRYAFITPNMLNDMHDGSVEDGDAWLSREVPKIRASPAYQDGGVLFIVWDEGSIVGHENPPFIMASPLGRKGFTSQVSYTTSSYLKTVQTILGLEPLLCDPAPDTVPTMDDLFSAPLTAR